MIVLEDIAGSEGMKDGELHRWAYISTRSGRTSSQFAIGVMQGGLVTRTLLKVARMDGRTGGRVEITYHGLNTSPFSRS